MLTTAAWFWEGLATRMKEFATEDPAPWGSVVMFESASMTASATCCLGNGAATVIDAPATIAQCRIMMDSPPKGMGARLFAQMNIGGVVE